MNKHIVKHIVKPMAPVLERYFIFGALYPSKSGLMNKHLVKEVKWRL